MRVELPSRRKNTVEPEPTPSASAAEQIELPTHKKRAQHPKKQAEKPDIHSELPQSLEAEQGILGSIFSDCQFHHRFDVIAEVAGSITPWYFCNRSNQTIYEVMLSLYRDGIQIDLITFTQILRDRKLLDSVGGPGYIADLFNFVPTADNVQWYIEIVREKFVLRETIAIGNRIVAAAFGARDDEAAELLSDFSLKIERIKRYAGWSNGIKPLQPSELLELKGQPDPNNLVGNRWLCRGGNCLWSGGAGYGKSTLATQFAIYWAIGQRCFGVRPIRPLKSLIIQSENDDFDVSEQYNGVLSGIELQEQDRVTVDKNVTFVRVEGKSGHPFLVELERLLSLMRPDLVWIDPLFAFAGCDLMNAEKTGYFLREGLFPMFTKFQCCGNIVHHIAKPPKEEKSDKPVIEYQYAAFGSSEIQNAFRAVNTLQPISFAERIYKLVFSKRGRRAGAKTPDGHLTSAIYLKQSEDSSDIYWTQVEQPEKPTKKGTLTWTEDQVLGEMSVAKGWKTTALQKHMRTEIGMPPMCFYRLWADLKTNKKIDTDGEGGWIKI
jgi:DnaB-like helicase N terminal domain/AAA domain